MHSLRKRCLGVATRWDETGRRQCEAIVVVVVVAVVVVVVAVGLIVVNGLFFFLVLLQTRGVGLLTSL